MSNLSWAYAAAQPRILGLYQCLVASCVPV